MPVPAAIVDRWEGPHAQQAAAATYPPPKPARSLETRFFIDDSSREPVVGVFDSLTDEAVVEIPPEAIRRLAESLLRAATGQAVDASA